ncbi:recombination regulator RecX [Polaromonas sp.]|uniref:recombination regulator RecX n=1 Tax=Polaromonas sp. TaxID=1869339 RepID=UPI003566C1A3
MTANITAGPPTPSPGFGLSLKGRALRYLAAREHSRAELERKLAAHAESPAQLAQVLDELQAKDFISEARVIESVINRRQAKLGASRIKYELQGKGLAPEAVLHALDGLKATEVERAREVWRKKFDAKTGAATDAAARAKQMRFLAARGFGADAIRRVVSQSGDD